MPLTNVTQGLIRITLLLALVSPVHASQNKTFSHTLCQDSNYHCIKTKRGDSWRRLFPNAEERDIVMRVNRLNLKIRPGMTLAIPNQLEALTLYDVSPFPRYSDKIDEKTIIISQKLLAYGAYDDSGELLWWGPVSTGANRCRGQKTPCHTPGGAFRIVSKQGVECISGAYPRRADGNHGGAVMPYCMHFFRGYALHGSPAVTGARASHGCVRLFVEDAKWLNEHFITTSYEAEKGTRVIIEPIDS